MTPEPAEPATFHWWRWLRRGGLLLITVVVVEYVVLPQLITAGSDMSLLGSATAWVLVVALGFELASLLCFSALSRASLSAGTRPSYWTLLRIDVSGLGMSHVLPGGGATAAALRYRLLTRAGVPAPDAVMGATIETAAAMVVLVTVFLSGIMLSFPAILDQPSLVVSGLVGLVLLLVVLSGTLLLTRRRAVTLAVVHRLSTRLPRLRATALEGLLDGLADRLGTLVHDRRLLARTLGWAVGNWLLDAACLWLCLQAYGFSERVGPLLALYGAVNLLAMVPTTPGGLGLVEGVLVPALVSVGAPASVALLGVITWRLLQYWLPMLLAVAAYVSLRTSRSSPTGVRQADAGRAAADDVSCARGPAAS